MIDYRRRGSRLRARLARLDRRLLARVGRSRTPARDRILTVTSNAANNGLLWYGVAAVLTATGRRRPRTAAASGLLGLGVASALVNGPLKYLWQRDRPAPGGPGVQETLLPLPKTFSFPSGHAASAAAFATGVSAALPSAAAVVVPLAGTVAYSRVHTGVHYPSDVVVGAAIGAGAGLAAARIATAVRASSVHHPDAPSLDVAVPRRVVVLTSPKAGSADELSTARSALVDSGFEITAEVPVRELPRLERLLREAGDAPPLVVAAGGDGTVGAAAGAIAGTGTLLAIIPLGTSNDVARSLGIPPNAAEAARVLSHGRVCAIDAGRLRINGTENRIYLNAATAGLNVAFAQLATTSAMRDRFGGLTYPLAAATALRRYVPFECTMEVDGSRRKLRLVHLSVSNATVFGGVLGMRVPRASLTDGLLDVIAIERLSIARLVLAIADTLIGRHKPVHRVHALQVRTLQVSPVFGADSQEIAVDGEVVGALPAEFSVQPGAVRVVVPPAPVAVNATLR